MSENVPGWTVALPSLKLVKRDTDGTQWIVLGEVERSGMFVFVGRWDNMVITDYPSRYHLLKSV